VIFSANVGPQTIFLSASEQEVLYGGAAGSGKTMAIIADSLRDTQNGAFVGLLIRRTTDELREIKAKTLELYPQVYPSARWSEKENEWKFPSGARLWLTYLERDADVLRYQGQAFSYIAVDELTQYHTPYAWDYLRSRLRTTDPHLKVYQRACVDEGDVLTEHGWKPIQSIIVGEKVYSLDAGGKLILNKVETVSSYDINEEIVRVRKKNLYMSMTQDHRVLYKKQNSEILELIKWNAHKSKSIDVARTSTAWISSREYNNYTGKFKDGINYAKFLGLYVAEGCYNSNPKNSNYKVIITQNKEKNHPVIRSILDDSGYKYCYSKNGDFQITNKALRESLLVLGKAKDKHFPRMFLDNASNAQLQSAFDMYMLGDGHWSSETNGIAVTTSRQLVDDLQEIAIKLGYKTQYSHVPSINPNHNDRYNVYFTLNSNTTKVDKGDIRNDVSLEKYEGKVYCLGVENLNNFVIRQKEYVWISGNSTNPGGPGHNWVKKMFIDPAPWGTAFEAVDQETGEVLAYPKDHPKFAGQPLFHRRFIPGKLKDNPFLYDDGKYEANLLSMPEHQRKQLLEGSWDVVEGAAFPEWNRNVHVVKRHAIPQSWRKFRAADYGYTSRAACVWFAINPEGQLVIYRELYTRLLNAPKFAQAVLDLEKDDNVSYGIMDSSVFHHKGDAGVSIAEQMANQGCFWRPSDRSKGSRINGKNELHRRLEVNEITEKPGLIIMDNCVNTIAQLPLLQLDKNNSEDVDTKGEDHIYDAIRYGIMSRPSPIITDYMILQRPRSNDFAPSDNTFGY
jgi:hypothetical protein